MRERYGIVLVGCGYIGKAYLEDIAFRDQIRLVGTADVDQHAAMAAARRYGAVCWSADYRELIARSDVDIVIIATYAQSHLAILKDCLKAGKHVLCEKPMVAREEELEEFLLAVRNARTKVLIAHVLRHNDSYRRLHDMIADGMIGEPRVLRMVQNHHHMGQHRLTALLEDCSPVVDCGVHYIDVARWFTGQEVQSIAGIGSRISVPEDAPHFDYGMLTMRMSGGAVAYYEAGWARTIAFQNLKEFIGTKGRIRFTLQSERYFDREEGDLIEYYDGQSGRYQIINHQSVYKNMWGQLLHLIRMIEAGIPAEPTMEDAAQAMRIAFAGDRAIRTGAVVHFSEK